MERQIKSVRVLPRNGNCTTFYFNNVDEAKKFLANDPGEIVINIEDSVVRQERIDSGDEHISVPKHIALQYSILRKGLIEATQILAQGKHFDGTLFENQDCPQDVPNDYKAIFILHKALCSANQNTLL